MTINQIINRIQRTAQWTKNKDFGSKIYKKWNYFFYLLLVFLFFITFTIISNFVNQKNKVKNENFNSIVESKELLSVSEYFTSKINSPYREIKYLIQNNDSVEKILKKYQINANDIKIISNSLKKRKLTNIYAGKELSLILKKLEDGSNTVINLLYPINNTTRIEIRKNSNN